MIDLEESHKKIREALLFYSELAHCSVVHIPSSMNGIGHVIEGDRGVKARLALYEMDKIEKEYMKLLNLLSEMDAYLNKGTSATCIHQDSIFHKEIKTLLEELK